MAFKAGITTEIELTDTPEKFREAVQQELAKNEGSTIIKVIKKVDYPYIDKNKELIIYKADVVYTNLMILFSQYGEGNRVSRDSMVAGDCMVFVDYWNDYLKSLGGTSN